MVAELVGQWSGHPARAGLAMVRQGLDLVLGASVWSLSDTEVTEVLVG